MKYKKNQEEFNAVQWWKNGDHPEDHSHLVYPGHNSMTQFEPFLSEGKAVRHYRKPDSHGWEKCNTCGAALHDHGWIDIAGGGYTVCPGDWIITDAMGGRCACKPDIFEATYERIA